MKKDFGYVTDREGNAVAGAEVYVRKQSDNTLLTLYSDNGSTTTANPLVTDNDGEYSFYTADNVIKVQTFVDGVQQQEINNVLHYDLSVISAFAWTILDDAAAGDVLTTIGAQPLDTDLTAIAALTSAADKGLQSTGAGTWALYDLTTAGKALLDDASAADQRTTLGLVLSTAAEYRNDTADRVLTGGIVWDAAEPVALTPGTNVSLDLSTGINFTLAMGGNYTLANATNAKPGQCGFIKLTQDGTGSRTLAYGTNYLWDGGTDGVLSTAASAKDVLYYQVLSATEIHLTLRKAIA